MVAALSLSCAAPDAPPTDPPAPDDPTTDTPAAVDTAPWVDPPWEIVGDVPALFDAPHGVYDAPLTLTLSAAQGTTVRYTLDATDPTGPTGQAYTGPLTIDHTTVVRAARVDATGAAVGPTETRTYVFPADVPTQAAPPSWPTSWWTLADGGPYPADYGMDPEVTGGATWASATTLFRDAPILSLVVPPDDLFGPNGIHENPLEGGDLWERAGSIEIFEATPGSSLDAAESCGVRIHGGAGRRPDRSPKKNFRLAFRDVYGEGRLDAPLFPDTEVTSFDTVVLRAGYNRSWYHFEEIQRQRSQYLHERFATTLQRAAGGLGPHVRLVHLFLDGLYWGVYQLEERPDAAFQASYLGGDEDDYDAINAGEVNHGDSAAWDTLLDLVRRDLSDPAAYAEVEAWLDVDDFIAYMLVNLTLGNADWPDKNWWAGRARADGARWRFFVWDGELTLPSTYGTYSQVADPGGPGEIFQQLRLNPAFRDRFADRVQELLFDGGPLSTEALVATWSGLGPTAWPTLVAESARWGDHMRDDRLTPGAALYTWEDHWVPEHARVRDDVLPERVGVTVADFIAQGLFPAVAAPDLTPHGGPIAAGGQATLTGPGEVWYTVDGADPRGADGLPAPTATLATGPLTFAVDAIVTARSRQSGVWSARIRASFDVP
jgi:hypothetical protein